MPAADALSWAQHRTQYRQFDDYVWQIALDHVANKVSRSVMSLMIDVAESSSKKCQYFAVEL